jgi:hypothetical protein
MVDARAAVPVSGGGLRHTGVWKVRATVAGSVIREREVEGARAAPAASPRALRVLAHVTFFLLLAQFLMGMVVNLYVVIPKVHPGSTGPDYFGRLLQGVPWAVAHGALPLQLHATLGLALVALSLVLVVLAVRARRRAWVVAALSGAFGVIGAGFNGGSFLNYGHDFSSLFMAIGFAVAVAAYASGLFLTG